MSATGLPSISSRNTVSTPKLRTTHSSSHQVPAASYTVFHFVRISFFVKDHTCLVSRRNLPKMSHRVYCLPMLTVTTKHGLV
jgi:hypothetical protein